MARLPKARNTEEDTEDKIEIVVKKMRTIITPATIVQIRLQDSKPSQILKIFQISQLYCRNRRYSKYCRITQMRLRTLSLKSQILQILQIILISQIYYRNRRYCKYRRIMQIRDSEPLSQKLQIFQISQIYYRNYRYCKYCRIIQMSLGIPIIETQILQILQNYPNEIQNPHRRKHRYCKYCRYTTENADIGNIAELSK